MSPGGACAREAQVHMQVLCDLLQYNKLLSYVRVVVRRTQWRLAAVEQRIIQPRHALFRTRMLLLQALPESQSPFTS